MSQSSSKAIIDWASFSIGHGGTVSIQNGSGATLNRVTGTSVSSLDGLLSSTGSVYLINPNGVIIGRSGVVYVGGTFVASTLDMATASFLSGGPLDFTGASSAAVISYGKVGSLGGDVALIATHVTNAGSISAPNGDAGLIAGSQVVLKDATLDEGRFSVLLSGSGTSVANSGLIQAADAELKAEGGNVYALAGDTAGVVRATGVSSGGGHIWLVADQGTLDVAGVLEAQGAGGAPGSVETSGKTVDVEAANIDAHGGTWTVDPYDLTINATAAATIDNSLNAGTSVTEETSASGSGGAGTANPNGSGDIIVAAPISWSTTAGLSLSAFRNIDINAAVTASGGGALILTTNTGAATGAAAGTLNFGPSGNVRFTGTNLGQPTGSLTINGQAYTLVGTAAALAGDIAIGNAGYYALATAITDGAGNNLTFETSQTPFAGVLEGLGNTVTNYGTADLGYGYAGMFGQIGATGVVRDMIMTDASVQGGGGLNNMADYIGLLAGNNEGSIVNVHVAGAVTGGGIDSFNYAVLTAGAGGLVGQNSGSITGSSANVTVSAASSTGGLVGDNGGPLTNDSASGIITGYGGVGGLVGTSTTATISNSYSNATLPGGGGGLVGVLDSGAIINSYATGNVSGGGTGGGLVGNSAGTISNSYATGSVTGSQYATLGGLVAANSGTITDSYATGAVSGALTVVSYAGNQNVPQYYGYVGGLVGINSGAITGAAASGSVAGGEMAAAGGLVGFNSGTIASSTASGAVSAQGSDGIAALPDNGIESAVGGLVGDNGSPGTITNAYATGAVAGLGDGGNLTGGLVGVNNGASVAYAYAIGKVSGASTSEGGAIGLNLGSSTLTDIYYDAVATGQSSGVGNQTDAAAGVTSIGGTGASPYATSTYAGFGFGTTSGSTSPAWVMVDVDGSFNNAGGAAGGTRPMLLTEYSTSIVNLHQLQLMGLGLSANYTMAGNVDAGATATAGGFWSSAGFVPIGTSAAPLTGGFDGAGHTIQNLYIDAARADVGLIGVSTGTVADVSLQGGSVTGGDDASVAPLVGLNQGGSVTGASAAVTVSGGAGGYVGGLVAQSVNGNMADDAAYGAVNGAGGATAGGLVGAVEGGTLNGGLASGAVTGGEDSVVGGLVGSSSGAIQNAYATGAATAGASGPVGGLVGYNPGTITNAYATGLVSGGATAGGLVGSGSGAIADGYFDIGTTGQSGGVGSGAQTGVTAIGGSTGVSPYSTSTYQGFSFGGLGSGARWVLIDQDATLNNAGGAAGGTRPMLLFEYSTSIDNAHALQLMALNPAATYTLAGNVDAVGTGMASDVWGPTGFVPVGLSGAFDGHLNTLSNLTINGSSESEVGLFSVTSAAASISNLNLTNVAISSAYPGGEVQGLAGGLVGYNGGVIANVSVTGAVSGPASVAVGGVAGQNVGTITGSSSSATATTGTGTLSQPGYAGGLVGYNAPGATLSADLASGNASGGDETSVGGLAGANSGSVAASFATGNETGGVGSSVGGLVGENFATGTITTTYATGSTSANLDNPVTGASSGGLVGANYGGTISQSYATGAVRGGRGVNEGGLVGFNSGAISDSYALGSVTGSGTAYTNGAGGFVGYNDGSITTAYSTGAVGGTDTGVGGFAGLNAAPGSFGANDPGGSFSGAFYDSQTSGQGANAVQGGAATGVTGLTSAQFTSTASFTGATGWTFGASAGTGTWVIVDQDGTLNNANSAAGTTRPFLTAEYSTTITGVHQLQLMAMNPGADYTLANDVDASATADSISAPSSNMWLSTGFGPIGSTSTPFTGGIDGGGHTISGLTVAIPGSYAGLFGQIGVGGAVDDLNLSDVSISGGGYVGGVAGDNLGAISSVAVNGNVTVDGQGGVGGVTGVNEAGAALYKDTSTATVASIGCTTGCDTGGIAGANFGTVASSATGGTVMAPGDNVGGQVGYNAGIIGGAVSTAVVEGAHYVGGLVGVNYAQVIGSTASGSTSGTDYVGGLVGWNDGLALIQTSQANGTVTASDAFAGGLAGVNKGSITGSQASSAVNGGDYAGGLIGFGFGNNFVQNDTATGTVAGVDYVGGLVGDIVGGNLNSLTYAAAGAGVSGAVFVGGAVGFAGPSGFLYNVGVTGAVSGTSNVGGVIGDNQSTSAQGLAAAGSVTAPGLVGGVVGVNEANAFIETATSAMTVTSTGNNVGGGAGENLGTLELLVFSGSVTGQDVVGGGAGYNTAGGVVTVDLTGQVSGRDNVGGVAGVNAGSVSFYQASSPSTPGTVSGRNSVGGVVGWNQAQAPTQGLYNSNNANVTATGSDVGGLVGVNQATISSNFFGALVQYNTSGQPIGPTPPELTVTGASNVGGWVGLNQGTVSYGDSLGDVSGGTAVGGLVGRNDVGGSVSTSYAGGTVTGIAGAQDPVTQDDYVGGIVGVNYGSIANTVAMGAVFGVQVVGGLVGSNMAGASLSTSYAYNPVAASRFIAGTTVGVQAGTVTDVYGFPSISGQATETGFDASTGSGDGVDLTAAQADGSAAYHGFDFTNVWQANANNPPNLRPPSSPP